MKPTIKASSTVIPGTDYAKVIDIMGQPIRDHGSGVYLLEYSLDPAGYAVVLFDLQNRVREVLVVWASDQVKSFPAQFDKRWLAQDPRGAPSFLNRNDTECDTVMQLDDFFGSGLLSTHLQPASGTVDNDVICFGNHGVAYVRKADGIVIRVECAWWIGESD